MQRARLILRQPICEADFDAGSFGYRPGRQAHQALDAIRFGHVEPSPQARLQLRAAVREELKHWTKHRRGAEAVRRVNRLTRGWSNYYHYGHGSKAFGRQQSWLRNRVRRWRWRKYDCQHGRFSFFTDERLVGQYQLWPLPLTCGWRR